MKQIIGFDTASYSSNIPPVITIETPTGPSLGCGIISAGFGLLFAYLTIISRGDSGMAIVGFAAFGALCMSWMSFLTAKPKVLTIDVAARTWSRQVGRGVSAKVTNGTFADFDNVGAMPYDRSGYSVVLRGNNNFGSARLLTCATPSHAMLQAAAYAKAIGIPDGTHVWGMPPWK